MKLLSFAGPGGARVGVAVGAAVHDVSDWVAALHLPGTVQRTLAASGREAAPGGMLRLLQAGPDAMAELGRHIATIADAGRPLADLTLLAPVPRPGKIVAIGRNYADHASETGVTAFEKPRIIAKLPSSTIAPGSIVQRPATVSKLDYEVELAVVIGSTAQSVSAADALPHVAGYTILNDLSAREFQFDVSPPQTTFAKSMDGFAPMGPWIVTVDEIGDPQTLDLSCRLNGEVMQSASTGDMLFPVAELIAYVSGFMTLEPGDIIATGTPAGIGAFRKPPRYLQPGDHLRLEISGIGVLEHGIG